MMRESVEWKEVLSFFGNWASIIGVLIAVVGFLLTIKQAIRARKAAENAQEAARDAVHRVGERLIANEVGQALRLVRGLNDSCQNRNWRLALERCDDIRERMAGLVDSRFLDRREKRTVSSQLDDLRRVQLAINVISHSDRRRSEDLSDDGLRRLHRMVEFLARIEGRIRDDMMEISQVE